MNHKSKIIYLQKRYYYLGRQLIHFVLNQKYIFLIKVQIVSKLKDFIAIIKVKIGWYYLILTHFVGTYFSTILFYLIVVTNSDSHNWISEAGYDQILWGLQTLKAATICSSKMAKILQ